MNKLDVAAFFDRCAPTWDAELIKSDTIIGKILDNAEVCEGQDVLDVACGTGVMFPYYLERGVASVTGIDISTEMARIAGEKFAGEIKLLASLLKEDGRLTVAHGQGREAIDNHHKGGASKVSNGLMSADSLKALFTPCFDVEVTVSNRRMYQVSGVKRDPKAHSHGGYSHTHDHDHSHSHSHGAALDATPMEELLALMKFMVNHNDAHAQELAELAEQLSSAGKIRAYNQIMDAVANFDMVNAQLDGVLKELSAEEF